MTAPQDYTGLPGWYVVQLISPRLVALAREAGAHLPESTPQEMAVAGGTIVALRGGPSTTYMNDLLNNRVGICGLHMAEMILQACGLSISTVRQDMFIPFRGFRPALQMAGDELHALHLPLTEASLLDRAHHLADRRDMLLNLRPH